jgi:hypothetical protein
MATGLDRVVAAALWLDAAWVLVSTGLLLLVSGIRLQRVELPGRLTRP